MSPTACRVEHGTNHWTQEKFWLISGLTSSRRRTSTHAKVFCAADRRASEHAFRFLRVLAADLSTRHSWCDINLDDVNTRIYFSESTRPRLSGSEQSAHQTMNEFTLFVDICLIPLSNAFWSMYEIPSFRPCPGRRVGRYFELANGLILPKKDNRNKKTSH